jgi:transposase
MALRLAALARPEVNIGISDQVGDCQICMKRSDCYHLGISELPIDNNHIENRIRPIALGRSNGFFAGSVRAGRRAATIMSLIQSAKPKGHDPYGYLKDILERLPTQPMSRLEQLLLRQWSSH